MSEFDIYLIYYSNNRTLVRLLHKQLLQESSTVPDGVKYSIATSRQG